MKLSEIKITPLLNTLRFTKISDDVYFSEKYSNYISNSRLSLLAKTPENPDRFFEGIKMGYDNISSLQRGSALHELVLQPDLFYMTNINKPSGKTGAMADELYQSSGRFPTFQEMKAASKKIGFYKATFNSVRAESLKNSCKEYWRSRSEYEHSSEYVHNKKTPIYLDEKSRDLVNSCVYKLGKDKNIQELLHPDLDTKYIGNEQAILLNLKIECPNFEPFCLRLKAKLDNYSLDPLTNTITVNDVKTTGQPIQFFKSAIEKFSYNREIAMYSYLLGFVARKFYGFNKPEIQGNFLVVEMGNDFNTKVYPMTTDLFQTGFNQFKHLLKLVAFYCTLPEYEGFREELIDI